MKSKGGLIVNKVLIGMAAIFLYTNSVQASWVKDSGETSDLNNNNYIAGYSIGAEAEYRNWFVFDLGDIDTVSDASLRVYINELYFGGYSSDDIFETWAVWDVSSSVYELTNGINSLSVFEDLGSGALFGETNIAKDDEGSFIEVELNAQALASLSSADGLWAIGGSVTTLGDKSESQIIFSSSLGDQVELVVNGATVLEREVFATPVPVPAAIWLFGSGVFGLIGLARRSKV